MKKLAIIAALAAAAVAAYKWEHRTSARDAAAVEAQDARLVKDRIWIDHMPRSDRDAVQIFVALSRQPVGVFQQASQWKGTYEGFRFEAQGEEMRIVYPQTGDKEKVRARATRCKERGMDYCLELEGSSHGVKKYYSREGWDVRSLDEERARVDEIEAAAGEQ